MDQSVFVTEWCRFGPMHFALKARWPAHRAVPLLGGGLDPMLISQTHRQSSLLIAHAALGVPSSDQTMLQNLNFTVAPEGRLPADQTALVDVEVSCAEAGRRGRVLTGLHTEIDIRNDGALLAHTDCDFSWVSPAVYRRLRGERLEAAWGQEPIPDPVPAHSVGRADDIEVVLAPTGQSGRWMLRNEIGNLALFDHAVDHVPGLVLVEAAHQAAFALTEGAFQPTAVTNTFCRYVEFGAPCRIEAAELPSTVPDTVTVEVIGRQNGDVTFRSTLTGPRRP